MSRVRLLGRLRPLLQQPVLAQLDLDVHGRPLVVIVDLRVDHAQPATVYFCLAHEELAQAPAVWPAGLKDAPVARAVVRAVIAAGAECGEAVLFPQPIRLSGSWFRAHPDGLVLAT